MTVIDILSRVDDICKKYDKYDVDKLKDSAHAHSDDPFARLFARVEDDIDAALAKSEAAAREKNRAASVAMNAEIRRTKARLLEDVQKLQKLALKKVKGLAKEDYSIRADLVVALPERIRVIPDGVTGDNQENVWNGNSTATSSEIKFNMSSDGLLDENFFQQSAESNQFRQEYEMRRMKQDQGLDSIAEGLDTLKNLASDMNEELDRQVPLMDEIDSKVDLATSDLKNTNVRLKETLNQIRSSRNFFIDIILLCVILGIAAYLYNVLNQ